MEKLFFSTTFESIVWTLICLAAIVAASAVALYGIYFLLTKFMFRRSRQRKEVSLRLTLLWAIVLYLLLFNVYLYILLQRNDFDLGVRHLLGVLPQLLCVVLLVIFFYIERRQLRKLITNNSLN